MKARNGIHVFRESTQMTLSAAEDENSSLSIVPVLQLSWKCRNSWDSPLGLVRWRARWWQGQGWRVRILLRHADVSVFTELCFLSRSCSFRHIVCLVHKWARENR
jgi:hypothetical protein